MSGTLYVVATPIGNLEDITLRALRVMREANLIAAEDTRRTAKLLAHYSISTPTISFHEHNSRTRTPQLLARLDAGANIALVSDAGTPVVADPGLALVQACWKRSISVDPVPGACAPLAAAVASGFSLEPLTIFGFAPVRSKDKTTWLQELKKIKSTMTFFEAPHRIQRTLSDLHQYFGNRPICVARELTKLHQEIVIGDSLSVIGQMTNMKGEFTVVIGPASATEPSEGPPSDSDLYGEFCDMTNELPNKRAAIAVLAKKYGLTPNYLYGVIERLRGPRA